MARVGARQVDREVGLFPAAEVAEKCIHPGLFADDRGLAVLRLCYTCGEHVPNREL